MTVKIGARLAQAVQFARQEEGHAGPLPGMVIGAAGMVALGIGAAGDTGWLALVGGIVAGVGFVASSVLHHIKVEYEVFKRLDELEKRK